jgi:hypothetical protein
MPPRLSAAQRHVSLMSVLVTLAMSPQAVAAPPADLSATLARLEGAQEAIAASESTLEQRYGYAGSKETASERLGEARVVGSSERIAARLYVLWRKTQPFFLVHQARLAAQHAAWSARGHVPQHEREWLDVVLAEVDTQSKALGESLEHVITLSMQRSALRTSVAEAEANLAATEQAMSGLGSRGMKDLVAKSRQAIIDANARLKAASAALAAHEAALVAGAQQELIPVYVQPSERALHALSAMRVGPTPATETAASAAPTAPLGTLSVRVAEAEATILTLQAAVTSARALQQRHQGAAEALSAELTSVRTPVDLPEVRAGMTQRGALEARINAQRDAIRAIDTSSPAGYRRAEEAAQSVLNLQGELPALDAELTRLRSKSYLDNWRRQTRKRVAKARASAQIQATEVTQKEGRVARATAEVMQLRGQLVDAALGLQLEEATRFAASTHAVPDLIDVEVTRPGRDEDVLVLRVDRPPHSAMVASVALMQTARSALSQSVATLARASALQAEADAAALPITQGAEVVNAVIARVWKRSIARLVLKGARGATQRALRSAFATPPNASAGGGGAAPSILAGDLSLALESFTTIMASKRVEAKVRTDVARALSRLGAERVAATSTEVEGIARRISQLAYQPFFTLASGLHKDAARAAEEAAEAASRLTTGTTAAMNGKATLGVPLRIGDPVWVTLRFEATKRPRCPDVALGPYPLKPATQNVVGACHYPLARLGPLPTGPTTLTIRAQP